MNIKILGSSCPNCKTLEARVREVLVELGVQAEVEKVTDMRAIMSYGIMATPGLVIDGVVKSAGRIPSKADIAAWVNVAQAS